MCTLHGVDRVARLELELQLYRECLELPRTDRPAPLLVRALGMLSRLVGADVGYIELSEETPRGRRWSADHGLGPEEREVVKKRVSRGIVAEAIESGEIVHTHSALLDERFSERASVRDNEIHEVLCVPLREGDVVGVVYLQNRAGAPSFDEAAIQSAMAVAAFFALVAERLLIFLRHRDGGDATASIRGRLSIPDVVGRSPALAAFLERLAVVAPMESNTLLLGPSGAGKSMFARILHEHSRRSNRPFVELNCAAFPEALVESELFGAVRGAHSAAIHGSYDGKVAAAAGGTLFLDEVGELPPNAEAKLLQLLQSKTYYPLGASQPIRANVRIVAATNMDPEQAMRDGGYREDLYYRLAGVMLHIPPLSERTEDIPLLARHILERTCREEGVAAMAFSPTALAMLEFSDWPGNVRQLENVCKAGFINARVEGVVQIQGRHLFPAAPARGEVTQTFQEARAGFERTFLVEALGRRDWNVARTARELDVSRSHLNSLIRKYEISRSDG